MKELTAFRQVLLNENFKENSIEIYLSSLKEYLLWKRSHLLIDDVYFILKLLKEDKLTISTINVRIAAINKYNNTVNNRKKTSLNYISFNSRAFVSFLDNNDILELFNKIDREKDLLIFYLMLYMGIGVNNLCLIKFDDIDYTNQSLSLENIVIPLHNKVVPLLYNYVDNVSTKSDYLFYFRGNNITASGFYRIITRYKDGIRDLNPTLLRSTFFNKLKNNNISKDLIYCIYSLVPEYYMMFNFDEIRKVINSVQYF